MSMIAPSTADVDFTHCFTIGKIDAGLAVLISDSVHLIEFPSLLLPPGVGPGSIINISCTQNVAAEQATLTEFWDLQSSILNEYGAEEPKAPKLRVKNTTQTSVTLEWDKLELAKAKLLELAIWRNGARLTTIPNPLNNTSTKLSGLALDTPYTFHLSLKTSAGTFTSSIAKIRTHTITDTSGISVCFGLVDPPSLLVEAKSALSAMGAKYTDKIQIETTHFVATSPASVANPTGGPGVEYQKALQLSIPVVSPEWVLSCHNEKKLVPIANYYSVGSTNHSLSISSSSPTSSTPAAAPSPSTSGGRTLLQQKPVRRATTAESSGPVSNEEPTREAVQGDAAPEAPPISPVEEVKRSEEYRGSEETIKVKDAGQGLDDLVAGKGKNAVEESVPIQVKSVPVNGPEEVEEGDESLVEIGL